jgi:hypothetical protein
MSYRNLPRGFGPISTNANKSMHPVDLDHLAKSGTRAQRRWAKRMIQQNIKPARKPDDRSGK